MATQRKRESSFYINGEKIVLKPFILPHLSKLTQDDLDKVAEAIALLIKNGESAVEEARAIVKSLTDKYPLRFE